jgi:hypothetical protein
VTRGRGLQSPIPAFRGSVVREGDNPISGAIADVVGRSLDPAKPCLLEQPSQATPRIRFSNTLGAPQLLTDVIKALRVGGLCAAKNDPGILHGGGGDTAASDDATQLRDDARRISQRFQHGMAQNRVEDPVAER